MTLHVLLPVYFPKQLLLAIFRNGTLSWWILCLSQYSVIYISLSNFPQIFHYFLFFLFYKLILFVQECRGADEEPLSHGHLRHLDVLGTIALIGASSPGYHCSLHDKFCRSCKTTHFWFILEAINLLLQEGMSPKVLCQVGQSFFSLSPFSFQLCHTHLWQTAGSKPRKKNRLYSSIIKSH